MARKRDPMKGTILGGLSLLMARPISRDALRVVSPMNPRARKKPMGAQSAGATQVARGSRQPELLKPRKQLFKRDGSILQLSVNQVEGPENALGSSEQSLLT